VDPAQQDKAMVAVERDNFGHGIQLVLSHQSQGIDLSGEAIVRIVQPRRVLLQGKCRTLRAYAIDTTIASSADRCELGTGAPSRDRILSAGETRLGSACHRTTPDMPSSTDDVRRSRPQPPSRRREFGPVGGKLVTKDFL
jgi:hypothetical protein